MLSTSISMNLIADGSSGAEVRVKITDAEGYAVTKLTPTLSASSGEVLAMKELGEGEYLFTLRAPPSSGAGNATLTVQSGTAPPSCDSRRRCDASTPPTILRRAT